jgi:hypothetical protein
LGRLSRDSGHTRVPDPPHMITGMIFAMIPLDAESLSRRQSASALTSSQSKGIRTMRRANQIHAAGRPRLHEPRLWRLSAQGEENSS